MIEKIHLSSPHMSDEGYEIDYIKEAFETNWIAPLGPNVDGFETEVLEYLGVGFYASALISGTAAIHLALKALDVKDGDLVFCSDLTFVASANPIIYQNAKPVFIDSEPNSLNMSPIALEKAFKKHRPKAVIVVNLYGQSADMDKIIDICNRHSVPIIEDAAESLGATYKGRMSGTFGDFGIFSFNGNKIITTSGGGMILSNNKESIEKIKFWATQARETERHYQHNEVGYNYRLSNISAGIGRGQLIVLDQRIQQKKNIYYKYKEGLREIKDIEMAPICEYGESNYWLSVILLDKESKIKPLDILYKLEEENIESRPVWKPMHLQPIYKDSPFYNHNDDGIPVSEDVFNRGLCLPSDTKMTDEDINRIVKIIKGLWGR